MDVFSSLFNQLQGALDRYIHETVANAVSYVSGPIALMATAVIIGLGITFMLGMSAWPFKELLKTFVTIALVFGLAGSVGHYNEYLGNHLHGLPGDLLGVFAVGTAPSDEQALGPRWTNSARRPWRASARSGTPGLAGRGSDTGF